MKEIGALLAGVVVVIVNSALGNPPISYPDKVVVVGILYLVIGGMK